MYITFNVILTYTMVDNSTLLMLEVDQGESRTRGVCGPQPVRVEGPIENLDAADRFDRYVGDRGADGEENQQSHEGLGADSRAPVIVHQNNIVEADAIRQNACRAGLLCPLRCVSLSAARLDGRANDAREQRVIASRYSQFSIR